MSKLGPLLRNARAFWPTNRSLPPNIEEAFAQRCAEQFDRHGRLIATLTFVCNLVWWPTDLIVFRLIPNSTHIAFESRVALALACLTYLFVPRIPFIKRNIISFFALGGAVVGFASAYAAGRLGNLDTPFFHAQYLGVFGTVPLPLPLRRRVAMTLLFAVSIASGIFLPNPENFNSPYVGYSVSFFIFGCLLSVWFGHTPYLLSRENFAQAQELSFHATALAESARQLESRVAERTEELRMILDNVETARETERTHIARELHDELGQELSALRYSLGYTVARYQKNPTSITANLGDLENLLARTATTTRHLVTNLRPRVLDDLGLEPALSWLVQRTDQRNDLSCKLEVQGDLTELPSRVATTAFRVVQEALTNIVRHAGAKNAKVMVECDATTVHIRIEDDGLGIAASRANLKKSNESSGVGLLGMRERIQALEGTFSMREASPSGTVIQCRLPLNPPSPRSRTKVAA